MSIENKRLILDKIKEYDRIVIFRHKLPDGDAVGSTMGLREIIRLTYPEKKVYLSNIDFSDYIDFLGDESPALPDSVYTDALGIVIDTAVTSRISSPKFSLCKELIKIDHHIPIQSYADYEWVEEERSSACEMIADFYNTFKDELKIDAAAATYIYTGMVTDSGRFRFRSVSGETMRLAGMLIECGVDTDHLYANLYMKDISALKYQSYVYDHIKLTDSGVAYIYISRKTQEKLSLTFEEACAAVSYMDSIKGSLIWLAFIEDKDGNIRVRLRSRFVTVNQIAEKYGGGGHDCASGATVTSRSEMNALIRDADAALAEYKSKNEDWI